MTATLKLKCTCGSIMAIAAKFAGKRAECNGCGHQFTVPSKTQKTQPKSAVTSAAASAATKTLDSKEQLAKSKAKEIEAQKARNQALSACPSCRMNMGQGTIVCISCGYHTKLKRRLEAFDPKKLGATKSEFEAGKKLTAFALYPAALAFVFGSSLWAPSVNGPEFLKFYFGLFCVLGLITMAGRKLWCDTDLFNYTAAAVVASVGCIRIIDSVMGERYRFMFLIIGIILSTAVFMLTTTEGEKHIASPFVEADSKLALWPFLSLFVFCAGMMAATFFVPEIGSVVVKTGFLLAAGFALIFGLWWAAMNFESFSDTENWSFGDSDCSSCSSCSSCGGGSSYGGGCGGCGG